MHRTILFVDGTEVKRALQDLVIICRRDVLLQCRERRPRRAALCLVELLPVGALSTQRFPQCLQASMDNT